MENVCQFVNFLQNMLTLSLCVMIPLDYKLHVAMTTRQLNMSIQGVLLLLIPDCLTFRVCKIGIFFNDRQIMQVPWAQAALGVWHHALQKKL